jgi:hypothetical protein
MAIVARLGTGDVIRCLVFGCIVRHTDAAHRICGELSDRNIVWLRCKRWFSVLARKSSFVGQLMLYCVRRLVADDVLCSGVTRQTGAENYSIGVKNFTHKKEQAAEPLGETHND